MWSPSKWWQDFVNRLAKANQKQFGNKRPSCCGEAHADAAKAEQKRPQPAKR